MEGIDLTNLLEVVLSALAGLTAVGGFWLKKRLAHWLDLKEDSEVRSYLNAAIDNAVGYANAHARVAAEQNSTVVSRDEKVTIGANYVLGLVPDAAARFGLTQEGVERIVSARLGIEDEWAARTSEVTS
tara:strand:- start:27 stop:413 length:387 start_codon:yes stop_codon:yes gene_type:complete